MAITTAPFERSQVARPFSSQDALVPMFGVGSAEHIEILTLRWPSGTVQHETDDLSVNRVIHITEFNHLLRRLQNPAISMQMAGSISAIFDFCQCLWLCEFAL